MRSHFHIRGWETNFEEFAPGLIRQIKEGFIERIFGISAQSRLTSFKSDPSAQLLRAAGNTESLHFDFTQLRPILRVS